jgi:uncharacterized protein (DUF58 family)
VTRLTPRGVATLVVAVAAFGVGVWTGYPLLRALAGAALGAVTAAFVITTRRPRVVVTREVYPDRVQRGRPTFARLRVHNAGTRRQSGFTAGDRAGYSFHAVTVRTLPPGADAVYHYELPTDRRGRHQVGPLTLERIDPLGLGRARLTTGATTTLWVHPRVHPVRTLAAGHPRHHHEGSTTDASLHGSLDLLDVREYVVGDEVRHLHWKATAHTGRLMVRDYVDPDQPRFTVLLDTRLAAGPIFEHAVELAASLAVASAMAGHRCRLVTPCGVDLRTRGGPLAVRQLLDQLCELGPAGDRSGPLVPMTLSRPGDRGGCLVVIAGTMGGATHADLAALAALRQHYSTTIVIVIGGGSFVRVPGARVLHASDAVDAAHRWNAMVAA